jgi:uncharacterized protein YjbI with pentapeptide repeats
MPECRHHAICGLTDEADPAAGLCILHSHQADKDSDAFTTALRVHRETRGDRFVSMVFPPQTYFLSYFFGATFSGPALFSGATFSGKANFFGATFSGEATLRDAIFSGEAAFFNTIFSTFHRF